MIKGEQLSFDKRGEITTPIQRAIHRLQSFEPPDGYYVAFSGGKDSQCIGCICCPMKGPKDKQKDFDRWPKYKELYLHAFARMIEERKKAGMAEGKQDWSTPEKVMAWWIGGKEE